MTNLRAAACLFICTTIGCSRGPERVSAPSIDPVGAAAQAISLYDSNGNQMLDGGELKKCPGILKMISAYDQNGNKTVEQEEIAQRLGDLLRHGTGATQLACTVKYGGRPLRGATVIFEPEPYLGEDIETAEGTTNDAGIAHLAIPPEALPKAVQKLKLIQYGTFKVRITHPQVKLPGKYNSDTELGYETIPGDPFVSFALGA